MLSFYQTIKNSRELNEEVILTAFEPKIKSSLRMTKPANREDLEQELKMHVIHYVREYAVDDVPGLFELNRRQRKRA
ncbi:hypothetical protein LCM20_17380 [Halobacillus litoralis]|uniref:hypothetical protein n=1 Tax=Halobacillus litoralis TaxID=45668 RepID=UPI001CD1A448|nr:hypothetical protein [Halobacillus litoralis]MCA0972382.1 hypothetical protein [Halobacillus litoralis]